MIRGLQVLGTALLLSATMAGSLYAHPEIGGINSLIIREMQKNKCRGVVVDEKGEPIIGATVQIKGTARGIQTNPDGAFVLDNVEPGVTLLVKYVGFRTAEVVYKGEELRIVLHEDLTQLEELVVIGYGVQKKANLTGSVSSVSAANLQERSNNNVLKSLQGAVPGVMIISRPGSSPSINFRGRGNLGTSSPLYVIDGVISNVREFESLDQNAIESISFLKDAASSSIYGARAAYGVVLVKTKEGRSDKVRVDYSGTIGVKNPTYISKPVSSAEYAILFNEAMRNTNPKAEPRYTDEEIELFRSGSDPDRYPNTRFFDELVRRNALTTQHSIGVSGKGQVKFYTNLGYVKDHNFNPGQSSDRFNLISNLSTDVKKWLTFHTNLKAMLLNNNNELGNFSMLEFLRVAPTFVGRHTDGTFGTIDGGRQASKANMKNNPFRAVYDGSWSKIQRKYATVDAGVDIRPIEGLVLSANLTYNAHMYSSKRYSPSRDRLINFVSKKPIPGTDREESKMSLVFVDNSYLTNNYTANYAKSFGEHTFNLLLGTAYEDYLSRSVNGYRKGFPNNSLEDVSAGSSSPENTYFSGGEKENEREINRYKIFSIFGRLNYDYQGKYLAEFNLRKDASSRFHRDHRQALFPSFSFGWRLSEEPFLKPYKWLNNLKLRASYGTLGNINNVGNYDYIATYKLSNNYVFDGKLAEGIRENKPANESLSWEKVAITDIGLDLDLFGNRLSIVADYYNKLTSDILLTPNIPKEIGLSEKPSQNIGKVLNKGLEVALSWRDEVSDFSYQVGMNMSYNQNEILDLGASDPIIEDNWIKKVGQPIGTFYGFKTDGLLTEEDIKKGYISDGTSLQPGDIKYVDINGDNTLNGDDRTYIGCDVPKLTYGVQLKMGYKGFDLSIFGQGIYGTKVSFGAEQAFAFFDDATPREYHLGRWTEENPNPNAVYPRIYSRTDAHSKFNQKFSDFWLFNSDYFRIKNITFGYAVPRSYIERFGLETLKMYVSAENYFTIRGDRRMRDFDPEAASGRGVSALGEKTISFGVNLSF